MTAGELKYVIDELIGQGSSFALFRLPGEETATLITGKEENISVYQDITCLNGKTGFVIAPFRITGQTPLVLISGQGKSFNILPLTPSKGGHHAASCPPLEGVRGEDGIRNGVSPEYQSRFQIFIRALKKNELDKLVLSRRTQYSRPDTFSPALTFMKAARRYIRSYVYLCHTPHTGTWLGSTPEIILSGHGQDWHTVALAGTQPLLNDELPQVWDEKNRKEQHLVAGYIRSQLATLGITTAEEGPYTVRAAELAHLKSDFRFQLPDTGHLGDVLKLLHPTPAVCGLPKEKAYRFILENEGYNRRYYSGFVGMLDAHGQTNLYVNLRCMEISGDYLSLYAGGGLLASSTLEEEWEETEDKLYTMRYLISSQKSVVSSQDSLATNY